MRYTNISFDPVKKTVTSNNQTVQLTDEDYYAVQRKFKIGDICAARRYVVSLFRKQEKEIRNRIP